MAIPGNISSVSSSFKIFGGQYNNVANPGVALYETTQTINKVKLTVQEWSGWYQNATGNTGKYRSGSLRIQDSTFSLVNGKTAGGWVTDAGSGATQPKNGFMRDLSLSLSAPLSPTSGASTVLAGVDSTAISASVLRSDEDSWFDDIEGMFTLGNAAYNSAGFRLDKTYHEGFRGINAYGAGGPNAEIHYAVYFIQNGYLQSSTTRENGRIVMYQASQANFTEMIRNIPLPISASIIETIVPNMDATGSVSLITYGGLPVLQPRIIYNQSAMFLPESSTFKIVSNVQP